MQQVDVAIVGGGPAGMSAAAAAADGGADVVVIEKGVPRADRADLGPDSTDAAGMLDYWIDLMDFDPGEIPDEVILQELDGADFFGPTESVSIDTTGMAAVYDGFGYAFDRVGMDDWLRARAEDQGATYRVGDGVRDVETDLSGGHTHTLKLSNGDEIETEYLILADGPQRQVTNRVLDRFMPAGESITDYLGTTRANHVAYQEHRRFPEEAFPASKIQFWWGAIPGETAYPWIFPNDETVARVGLTMPIGLSIEDVETPTDYTLLRANDDRLPKPDEYLRRLLQTEFGDEYDIEADFPLVEDRGKSGGTETYAISSTRPVESPTRAGIAIAGGAMATTSAFHEGGYHLAVRTGKIAGRLAANDRLTHYNAAWKDAIGAEILRNVSFAEIVQEFRPADWDRAFKATRRLLATDTPNQLLRWQLSAGVEGLRQLLRYRWQKWGFRDGQYVQVRESEYTT
ncbi:MAG: electron-transferring-flavoprotein dehydrogenase [Natrialbaceae archaeon]|jgi:electron-transferring-flavoprotein dehydrogenase